MEAHTAWTYLRMGKCERIHGCKYTSSACVKPIPDLCAGSVKRLCFPAGVHGIAPEGLLHWAQVICTFSGSAVYWQESSPRTGAIHRHCCADALPVILEGAGQHDGHLHFVHLVQTHNHHELNALMGNDWSQTQLLPCQGEPQCRSSSYCPGRLRTVTRLRVAHAP